MTFSIIFYRLKMSVNYYKNAKKNNKQILLEFVSFRL